MIVLGMIKRGSTMIDHLAGPASDGIGGIMRADPHAVAASSQYDDRLRLIRLGARDQDDHDPSFGDNIG